MAKPRNKRIISQDHDYLVQLQQEYKDYGDWDTELIGDTLTIYALHRKYQRRKDKAAKARRDKRSERYAKKKYVKED